MTITVRPAEPTDAKTILHFINELAIYEKEPDAVVNTVAEIEKNCSASRQEPTVSFVSKMARRSVLLSISLIIQPG